MSYEKLVTAIRGSLFETIAVALILTVGFAFIEPVVSRAQDTDEFTITQTITGAIAIVNKPIADLSMSGSIDGLTGGTAYGTSTVRVTTNNASGFQLTIQFSSTTAMVQNLSDGNDYINNFLHSTDTASYPAGFDTSPAYSQFGFTVNASNTSDISSVFTGTNGTSCGTGAGSTFTFYDCWRGASTTLGSTGATQLLNTSAPTPSSGSTSTITFRVTVPNSPNPAVSNGTYVATATLTATDN